MPAQLSGLSKPSFTLPYNGGEIRFEHLDHIYQYSDLTIEKLHTDRRDFCRPSAPARLAVVLFDTQISDELIAALIHDLCEGGKHFSRVAFIGLHPFDRKRVERALRTAAVFQYSFFNGIEPAKEYLLP